MTKRMKKMMKVKKKMTNNNKKANPMLDLTLELTKNYKISLDGWIKNIIRDTEEEIEELKLLQKQLRKLQKSDYKANMVGIWPHSCSDYVGKEVNDFTSVYSTYQLLKMIAEKGTGDIVEKHSADSMTDYTVSVVLFRNDTVYKYGFRFDSSYEDYDKAWDEFVKQVDLAVKDNKHRLKIELYEESHSPDPCVEEEPLVLYHYETGKIYRHNLSGWEDSFEEVTGDWENQGYHPADIEKKQ